MGRAFAGVAGGLIGFAVVFVGPPGLVLGTVAAAALLSVAISRRDATLVGIAVAAAGAVVAAVSARPVLMAFGDPKLSYDPQVILIMVVGAIVAGVGVLTTLVAWDRRPGRSNGGSASRT